MENKIQFQVTYDHENFPIFGLDMFDREEDAFALAEELESEGRENVVVTLFVDDAAICDVTHGNLRNFCKEINQS